MKKISVLFIIAILSAMLSACGNNGEEAKKIVGDYWNTLLDGDLKALTQYHHDDDNKGSTPSDYLEDYLEAMALSLSGIISDGQIEATVNEGCEKLLKRVEFTIGDVKSSGDEIIVNCVASMPDPSESIKNSKDTLYNLCGASDQKELLTKFLESKNLTLDTVSDAYAGDMQMIKEDFSKWLLDTYLSSFTDDLAQRVTMVQKSWDFVVEKDDGYWEIEEIKEK